MLPIKRMFNEVQYELVKIILLNVFLSTVILFLVADLVALVFNMPIWYVVIIAFIYFVVVMTTEVRKISMARVEKNNPELKEILRTASDSVQEDTLMAHALFQEVIEKMRRVSSGTFIDFKGLMIKIGAIFVLAIVLITITFFNVNIQKFDNPLEGPLGRLAGLFSGTSGDAFGNANIDGATDDIFGDPNMARLGGDDLIATVNPSLNNPDFNNIDPSSPSNDPLANLAGDGSDGFNAGGAGYTQEGLDERDLQRSYNYAKTQQ